MKTNPGKHQGLDESNVDRKARKAAAVKSMATKPGKKKAPQEPPPAEVSPKLEKPHGEVAQAVRSSLQRASTVDMKSTVLASQALEKKKRLRMMMVMMVTATTRMVSQQKTFAAERKFMHGTCASLGLSRVPQL